jgi:tetratricopeptide (TPR) repeat protein
MGIEEIVSKSLRVFNLGNKASLQEVRDVYLSKTFEKKFQKVIVYDETLEKEFLNYYEAYMRFLKYHRDDQDEAEGGFVASDQVFKLKFNQGVYYLINQQYIKAGEKLQEAFQINNKHVLLLIYLGIILLKRKNYYAGEKYFFKALDIDKNNDDGWFYLGEIYLQTGQYLGEIYLQTGQFEKALKMFKTCKSLNPLREEVAFKIKEISSKLGKKPEAAETKKKDSLIKKIIKKFDKNKPIDEN